MSWNPKWNFILIFTWPQVSTFAHEGKATQALNNLIMELLWFKRKGIFFLPVTIIGWTILLAGVALAVYCFIDIDSRSHSVSDTLRNFFFSLLIIGAVYSLVAFFTSRYSKA